MQKTTYDLLVMVCVIWFIIITFFIALTLEIFLMIGFIFPTLILIILEREKGQNKIK